MLSHVSNDNAMKVSKEFKIGLFVIVVITASFFLINYLRGKDIFNREMEISARYSDVEGLVASAPVYIKGYKAGKVSDVSYSPEDSGFTVTCSISKEFAVPADSRMVIYGVDIMGGKGIRIDLGESEQMVPDGGVLQGDCEADMLSSLADGLTPLLSKVNTTLDSLAVTVSSVNQTLSEQNRISISNTLRHLEMTMADVSGIAEGLGGRSEQINAFVDDLGDIADRIVVLTEKADTLVGNLAGITGSVSEADIRELVSSFKMLLENINDPDGTVGKLLVDDSVYDSLDSLLSDVDSLVNKIQENPRKYIKISVF